MRSTVEGSAPGAAEAVTARPSTRRSALLRHWPLWVALLVVGVGRLVLRDLPFSPDESGFYLVAHDLLHHGGDGIYGHYWVDRPPTLIWLFSIAAGLGEIAVVRWLVALAFLLFVVLSYATARRLGGSGGWAALVAAGFAVTPEVGAQVANGEAFAIPLVMASILSVVVAADHAGRRGLAWSWAAGFLGLLAMTVKQNFAEALVFALVVLVADGLRRKRTWPDVVRRLGAGVVGGLTAVLVMVAWTVATGASLAGLWLASVSFRGDATEVIRAGYRTGIESRQEALLSAAWTTGIIPLLLVVLAVALFCRLRGSAVAWATAVVIGVEVLGILVGGNFWSHYLLGLAPGAVLATGLAIPRADSPARPTDRRPVVSRDASGHPLRGLVARLPRRWPVMLAAVYLLGSSLVSMGEAHGSAASIRAERLGGFVAASAEPGDTATTVFGRADVQRQTGLRSPYEHLWSLPIRVLDPDLDEFTALLEGEDAPTWLVEFFSFHAWGLDPKGQVDPVLAARYEVVYDDCGSRIYKLRTAVRDLAPLPTC